MNHCLRTWVWVICMSSCRSDHVAGRQVHHHCRPRWEDQSESPQVSVQHPVLLPGTHTVSHWAGLKYLHISCMCNVWCSQDSSCLCPQVCQRSAGSSRSSTLAAVRIRGTCLFSHTNRRCDSFSCNCCASKVQHLDFFCFVSKCDPKETRKNHQTSGQICRFSCSNRRKLLIFYHINSLKWNAVLTSNQKNYLDKSFCF